jgi:hypothetical protein
MVLVVPQLGVVTVVVVKKTLFFLIHILGLITDR